jgi:hypothetical protein
MRCCFLDRSSKKIEDEPSKLVILCGICGRDNKCLYCSRPCHFMPSEAYYCPMHLSRVRFAPKGKFYCGIFYKNKF